MSRNSRIASVLSSVAAAVALAALSAPAVASPVAADDAPTTAPVPVSLAPADTADTAPLAAPAAVTPAPQVVYPNSGEGVISIVTRTCGTSANWTEVAAENNIVPPVYTVLLGQAVTVDCGATAPIEAVSPADVVPVAAAPAPPAPAPPAPAAPAPAADGPLPAVAGLDQQQSDNARIIVQVAKTRGLGRQAMIIALATALQECGLYNLANGNVPESYNYPNQGTGWDHDSVGLFQQRPGWGSVAERMNPWYSASAFYNVLVGFDYWDYPVTVAAQKVQVSAYPDAYAPHVPLATAIVDALL